MADTPHCHWKASMSLSKKTYDRKKLLEIQNEMDELRNEYFSKQEKIVMYESEINDMKSNN